VTDPSGEQGGAGHVEAREGAFYVWTLDELTHLLGDDAPVVARRFGVERDGNALADPQGEFRGQNILYVAQTVDEVSVRAERPIEQVMDVLARARRTLFDARARRPRPHLDDKVITAWNGLMIAACARAAVVLADSPRRDDWRRAGVAAARAVRTQLWRAPDRRLLRRLRDGEAAVEGFCEDYAYLIWGLVELVQATGEAEWLEWALELTSAMTERFYDERDGGWFSTTGEDASVLLRIKEDYDGAEPAAASVAVRTLIALGHLTGDASLLARAERTLQRYGPEIGRAVRVMPLMVANVALWHGGGTQVVVAGEPGDADTMALQAVVARQHMPWAIVVPPVPARARAALARALPWTAAMTGREGRPAAYVCDNFTCQLPATSPDTLEAQLQALLAGKRVTS
jgi:uncharacterized protein YyaL (SSP411 family)